MKNSQINLLKSYTKKILKEQNSTRCLTSGAVFDTKIKPKYVSIKVNMPFELDLDEKEAKELETLLHNAVELVMSRYFIKEK